MLNFKWTSARVGVRASCSGSRECYYLVQTRSTTMRDKKRKVWSFKHHLHRVGTFLHLRELGCDEGLQSIGSLTTHDSWSCSAVNEYYHSSAISDFFLIGGDPLQRRIFIFHKGWGQNAKLGPHSAIWGKLGTALQAYALNPCTKFPPNPTSRKVNT